MKLESLITNKSQASLLVFLVTLAFILREYFNEGVITHHLLASDDMPGFSNWWGLLTVPTVFWLGISLINRRQKDGVKMTSDSSKKLVLRRFLASLTFGLLMSLLWEFNVGHILQYLILLPILLSFFIPVYFPEYLMGFVLGMAFTFGGILPVIFGLVLLVICFLINRLVGFLRSLFTPKKGSI